MTWEEILAELINTALNQSGGDPAISIVATKGSDGEGFDLRDDETDPKTIAKTLESISKGPWAVEALWSDRVVARATLPKISKSVWPLVVVAVLGSAAVAGVFVATVPQRQQDALFRKYFGKK